MISHRQRPQQELARNESPTKWRRTIAGAKSRVNRNAQRGTLAVLAPRSPNGARGVLGKVNLDSRAVGLYNEQNITIVRLHWLNPVGAEHYVSSKRPHLSPGKRTGSNNHSGAGRCQSRFMLRAGRMIRSVRGWFGEAASAEQL